MRDSPLMWRADSDLKVYGKKPYLINLPPPHLYMKERKNEKEFTKNTTTNIQTIN